MTVSILNVSYAKRKGYSYIEKYKEIAVLEMKKSGIPASIKLAQGMLESS
ncbi:MAG: glucosaminidase domain-containing protein [Saprospiraceae bacterium]|nr:glucosaminidase domain-containing protein [Saprospiraceae bacterium]